MTSRDPAQAVNDVVTHNKMQQAKVSVRPCAQQGDSGEDEAVVPQILIVQHIEVQGQAHSQPVNNILRDIILVYSEI